LLKSETAFQLIEPFVLLARMPEREFGGSAIEEPFELLAEVLNSREVQETGCFSHRLALFTKQPGRLGKAQTVEQPLRRTSKHSGAIKTQVPG